MNGDDYRDVEERLRADADRLQTHHPGASVAALLAMDRRRRIRRRAGGAVAVLAVVVGLASLSLPTSPHRDPVVSNDRSRDSVHAPTSTDVVHHPIVGQMDRQLFHPESVPVPVLLVGRNEDGSNLVMPGLYVLHREPVSINRLPAVQRRAIREVLGMPKPLAPKQSI